LSSEPVRGATGGFPKRILFVYWANGVLDDSWWPKAPDLSELPYCTEVLAPWRDKLLFVDSLSFETAYDDSLVHGGHDANVHMLTGKFALPGAVGFDRPEARGAGGPSVDQFIAQSILAKEALPLPSLTLGVRVRNNRPAQGRWIYGPDGSPIAPQQDPAEVLRDLFGVGIDPAVLARIRADRRSVLDLVGKDLEQFSSRLGQHDRGQVEAHLAAIRELERQLDPELARQCTAPATEVPFDPQDPAFFPQTTELQMRIIASAFACDLTRVATLQLSDSGGDSLTFPWLEEADHGGLSFPAGTFSGQQHHGIAHAGGGGEDPVTGPVKRRVDRWFGEAFASLCSILSEYVEGDETLLDHTAVVWMNNMSNGAGHHMGRYRGSVPTVIAGSCCGHFRTGRHVTQGTSKVSHTRFLTSLCHALDVEVATFGDPGYTTGPLPDLTA
jgi:hypothetical protein